MAQVQQQASEGRLLVCLLSEYAIFYQLLKLLVFVYLQNTI